MIEERFPKDWQKGIIVLIRKSKRGRDECKNYGEISVLSVSGKVGGRVWYGLKK